ncbi:histidine kinase-like ATPase domain protein [Rhodococcus sp. MTM3W5.2]|uniref:ATP-binding protein n=1 Tax=Rhodococcus sp. MTM3W5.2 TaxID=1805827 RepID=UPI0009792FC8|nr:ATP-binding protein [Rhodococcus sp. MTM3W5.2]AQA21094.1 histidine kinase-like ATPase domain protein [Rhodococcus sp. MTM3W5.2]
MSRAHAEEPEQQTGPEVELRLPAHVDQLFLVRAMVTAIATQNDFDLDTIADLRLAVDEAATRLVRSARPDSTLLCRFRVHGREFGFSGSTSSGADETVAGLDHGFGWHVLRTLTDEVAAHQAPDPDRESHMILTIDFTRRAEGTTG